MGLKNHQLLCLQGNQSQMMNNLENSHSKDDHEQKDVVKLYPGENHTNYLRVELQQMFESEEYLDTELRCSDKRILRVNKLIAVLAFPELSSSLNFSNGQLDHTVLLPDFTFKDVTQKIEGLFCDSLISELTSSQGFDLSQVKHEVKVPSPETFDYFENCPEDFLDNESQNREIDCKDFLENSVQNQPEEKRGKFRSLTWNYFTKAKNSENLDIGKCNDCLAEIKTSGGNTTGLKTHLKANHKALYKQFMQNNSARAKRISIHQAKEEDKVRHRSSSRAYVWEYFSRNSGPSATCHLCQKIIKTPMSSTSGLIKHLESIHIEIFQQICHKCKCALHPEQLNLGCLNCQCRFHQECVSYVDLETWICTFCDQRKTDKSVKKTKNDEPKREELCPECGNGYRNLKQHLKKTHRGIKYYQPSECDICKKIFSTKSHLKTHVKTVHDGDKDYQCKFCDRAFSVKSQLKRHLLCMHQGYRINQNSVCPDCGRTFRLKGSMLKHRKVVHMGIKKNDHAVCDECGQNFTQRGTLYLHLRKVHGKEPAIINQNMVGKMTAEKSYVDPSLILEAHPDIDLDLNNKNNAYLWKDSNLDAQ